VSGLPADFPEPRYTKSRDLHIAYRVHGDGPLDVVVVPPSFWTIDTFGVEPEEVAAFTDLGSIGRVIVFDKRGIGSSDRTAGIPTLEERMDDVRAVMDAVNSPCAALVGAGADGGAMSMLFAATYPERVFALALLWATPRVAWAPDFVWGKDPEAHEQQTHQALRNRLRGMMVPIGEEGNPEDDELDQDASRNQARLVRLAASPGYLIAYQQMKLEIDVRSILPSIKVPTLLVYSLEKTTEISPFAEDVTRYMHERIPVSEMVSVGDGNWLEVAVPPLRQFLPRTWAETTTTLDEPTRVLATVLFTDLVESTRRARELGPRWREVLGQHNATIRRELVRYSGREIDTAGDGFFASGFDGPARAIHCACAIRSAVTDLGLAIRVGVHTGECDLVDDKLSGVAVNIGARVAAQAEAGEVLVSGTVKDLVAGSGITFESRGMRDLKGVGEWPLYAVMPEEHRTT
jgi:class 3 adenylate cyclase/pimeloyl-ACP methyl ester carboxylesterase